MPLFVSPRRFIPAATALALLFVAACTTPKRQVTPTLPTLTFEGSQAAVEEIDRQIAAAGKDTAQLNAIAHRLIGVLRDPAATVAARQAVAERLGRFSEATLTDGDNALVFAAMLIDGQQVNLARLAIEQVPGATIDALFVRALQTTADGARLALVQSAGNRRLAASVEQLRPLLASSDAALARSAALALGQIATREALAALKTAPNQAAPAVVEAKLEIAHRVGGRDAAQLFTEIADLADAPPHLRAAASHGLVGVEPAAAPRRITQALAGSDPVVKAVIIESLAAHPDEEIVPAIVADLARWDASTQAAVIPALGRRGDAAAVPAIAAATTHGDPSVRAAAISALGQLRGNPPVAQQLARIIAAGELEEAKLARQSLAQLNGDGVADAILAGARSGDAALRVVFIEQIALRYMIESIPLLLELRQDADATVRTAALGALGEIAPPAQQAAILDWAIAATLPSEQARALRTLASVTLRDPDAANRARLIIESLERADAATALRLLPVLSRIGGAACANAAATLALRDDPALSRTAVATLSRWPDKVGLAPLVDIANQAATPALRNAAAEGAVRFLERTRTLTSVELTGIVTRLLPATTAVPTRQKLAAILGHCSDDDALALAKQLQAEAPLAADATYAVLAITANRAGPAIAQASHGARQADRLLDGKTNRTWDTPAEAGISLELDFKLSRPFRRLTLDQAGRADNFPEQLEVFVTDNPKNPGAVRATAAGTPNQTVIDLPPDTRGRYVIIRSTVERPSGWWTIAEIYAD